MKAKVLKVAVPQDFAPFGSVGADLAPKGYDIDMANLIGKATGREGRDSVPVTSANRIPYLQTKKVDLVISSLGKNPDREKVIDFSGRLRAVLHRRLRHQGARARQGRGPRRQDHRRRRAARSRSRKSPRSRRRRTTIKRYEDNNATISAFISGQVELDRDRQRRGRRDPRAQPAEEARDRVPDRGTRRASWASTRASRS